MGKDISLKEKTITGVKITTAITTYRSVIEFALNLFLVRLLAPEVFGAMAFAFIIVNFAGMISTISSSSAIVQRGDEGIEKYLDVAFSVEIFLSALAAIILFASAPYIVTRLGRPELSFFSQMIALTIPLNKLAFPGVIFSRRLDFKKANIATALSIPASAVTTIVVALLDYGIWCFFWGSIVGGIISAIVVWRIVPYRPRLVFDFEIIKELARFGMPLTGSAVLAYYYWNVDDFMVGTMLGTEQLGFYWLAFKIPHYILNTQNNITSVVFPAFARVESDEQLKTGFELVTKLSAAILLLPCVLSLVLGEPIIRFIFGAKWLPALVPFQIFMVLIALRGTVIYWTQVLTVKKKTDVLLKITIQNAIVLTLLGYLFTEKYGILGTSVAVFLTIAVSLPYMTWQLKKCIDVSYVKILWKGIASFLLVLVTGLLINKSIRSASIYMFIIEFTLFSILYILSSALFDRKLLYVFKEIIHNKKYQRAG